MSHSVQVSTGQEIIKVANDSCQPEIMAIGHNKQSATLIPAVAEAEEFMIVDLPVS